MSPPQLHPIAPCGPRPVVSMTRTMSRSPHLCGFPCWLAWPQSVSWHHRSIVRSLVFQRHSNIQTRMIRAQSFSYPETGLFAIEFQPTSCSQSAWHHVHVCLTHTGSCVVGVNTANESVLLHELSNLLNRSKPRCVAHPGAIPTRPLFGFQRIQETVGRIVAELVLQFNFDFIDSLPEGRSSMQRSNPKCGIE